jgi:hypothetical protein
MEDDAVTSTDMLSLALPSEPMEDVALSARVAPCGAMLGTAQPCVALEELCHDMTAKRTNGGTLPSNTMPCGAEQTNGGLSTAEPTSAAL